ncbi:MAG: phosphatidate cytidylyltransferase [Candidatus Dadabacteria bacterium]|nr:phosphatidate cytidylyltransferase [Candidatus Dadabacteria bacterium]
MEERTNLIKRIATAAVAVPILLLIFYHGGLYYLAFICLITVLCSIEFFTLAGSEIRKSRRIYVTAISLLLVVSAFFDFIVMSLFFTFLIFLSIILEFRKKDFSDCLQDLGMTLLPLIYFGWMLAHGVLLRNISDGGNAATGFFYTGPGDIGFFLVVLAVSCTFFNDAGAFFFGKSFGRKKLAHHISSGKTVAGLIGGFFVSIVSAFVVNYIFEYPLPMAWVVLYAVIIAAVAVAGDLFESTIKRGVGVKDSGSLIPGHGGALDRFDSLIFVFPCTYYVSLIFFYSMGQII